MAGGEIVKDVRRGRSGPLHIAELFFDLVMELRFCFCDPAGQRLRHDLPVTIFFLHPEQDPVTAIIHHIDGKYTFIDTAQFPEVKLSETTFYFQQFGELNVLYKLDAHMLLLNILSYQFSCYTLPKPS